MEEEVVCEEGAPEWVVTFGDMMSLLLTFFILLLSFAEMDKLAFKDLAGKIQQGFGVVQPERITVIPKADSLIEPRKTKIEFNGRVMERLKKALAPDTPKHRRQKVDVEVFLTYRGVVALFPADSIFVPGTDTLRPGAHALLGYVAQSAVSSEDAYRVVAECRSPVDAPRDARFEDEWALTAAQAVAIGAVLKAHPALPERAVEPTARGSAPSQKRAGNSPPKSRPTVEFVFISRDMDSRP